MFEERFSSSLSTKDLTIYVYGKYIKPDSTNTKVRKILLCVLDKEFNNLSPNISQSLKL